MSSPESIHHIRRDLLDRPVREYADNLKAQILQAFIKHGARNTADFEHLVASKRIPEPELKRIKDLIARLAEVVRSGKIPEDELEHVVEQAREIFGDHFLGIEEVEKAFTLQDGQQLVVLSLDDKRHALELLQEKLDEPDVRAFLEGPTDKKNDWWLILRIPNFSIKGHHVPITAEQIQMKIDWDLHITAQSGTVPKVENWYKDQKFRIEETIPKMEWRIIRNTIARPTRGIGVTLVSLTMAAENLIDEVGFDQTKCRARSVVESFYDRVVIRRAADTKWSGGYETTTSRSDEVGLIDDAIHITTMDLRVGPSISDDYGLVITR